MTSTSKLDELQKKTLRKSKSQKQQTTTSTSKNSDEFHTVEMISKSDKSPKKTSRKSTSTSKNSDEFHTLEMISKSDESPKKTSKEKSNILRPEMLPKLPKALSSQIKALSEVNKKELDIGPNKILENLPRDVIIKTEKKIESLVQEAPISKKEREAMLKVLYDFFKRRTWDIHPKGLIGKGMLFLILWILLTFLHLYCKQTGIDLGDHWTLVKDFAIVIAQVQALNRATEWILRTIGVPERAIQCVVQFVNMIQSYYVTIKLQVYTLPHFLGAARKFVKATTKKVMQFAGLPSVANTIDLFGEGAILYFIFPYLLPLLNRLTSILIGNYKTNLQIEYEAKIKKLQQEGKELKKEKKKIQQEGKKLIKNLEGKIKNLENKIKKLQNKQAQKRMK